MGVSLEQVNQGVLDVGRIVTNAMNAWNTVITGRTPGIVAEPTTAPQPATPAAPATTVFSQAPTATAAAPLGVPAWVLGLAIIVLLWRLR